MVLVVDPITKRFAKIIWISVAYLALYACIGRSSLSPPSPTISPTLYYLSKFLLQDEDVPTEWYYDGDIFSANVPHANALETGFEGSSDPDKNYVFLKQQLQEYPNEEIAKDGFRSLLVLTSTQAANGGYLPDGFSYIAASDQFSFLCDNVFHQSKRLMHCEAIQLYGKMISDINVILDGTSITLNHVESVLSKVDEKLSEFKVAPTPAMVMQNTSTP